ncbi:hypothetical protein ACIBQ1_08555 [Nonomuraea sp. NPDC050153]|uniref:hypothetical protein n=1 Tax=Nonomuraea sp. NPDC050153 TaxID=3364359 RepID=UPI0037997A3B
MDVEACLLDLMSRVRALEAGAPISDAIKTTMAGIAQQVKADITEFRAELRQDLAALGDEVAGLRRHLNEHLSTARPEILHQPGSL